MRVALYVRVSTDRQVDEGTSLADQEAALRAWAARQGHDVAAVCPDAGSSGSLAPEHREGLATVIALADAGEVDAVAARDLDRLARSVTVQEAVLATLWAGGTRVFTLAGEVPRDDPDDPMRTAMRQMAGVFAQLERAVIAKRLRDGRRAKAARGGYAYGSPPYGWQAEAGQLVPVAAEQAVIRKAQRLARRGDSTRSIAAALNAAGHSTKRGAPWSSSTVSRLLTNARTRTRKVA